MPCYASHALPRLGEARQGERSRCVGKGATSKPSKTRVDPRCRLYGLLLFQIDPRGPYFFCLVRRGVTELWFRSVCGVFACVCAVCMLVFFCLQCNFLHLKLQTNEGLHVISK